MSPPNVTFAHLPELPELPPERRAAAELGARLLLAAVDPPEGCSVVVAWGSTETGQDESMPCPGTPATPKPRKAARRAL